MALITVPAMQVDEAEVRDLVATYEGRVSEDYPDGALVAFDDLAATAQDKAVIVRLILLEHMAECHINAATIRKGTENRPERGLLGGDLKQGA